jgi:hypothetical protein
MKPHYVTYAIAIIALSVFYGCNKEEYFQSEKSVKSDLQGTWNLIPIPKYTDIQVINGTDTTIVKKLRVESWFFNDTHVTIENNNGSGESGESEYSVHTSWTKAELKIESVSAPLSASFYNGTWQIVRLDGDILIIAGDKDGATGLTELEFQKRP